MGIPGSDSAPTFISRMELTGVWFLIYYIVYCFSFVCREYASKRREWLLHEANLFAHELLQKWKLGHCDEDVIVLYSVHDGVVSAVHL